MSETSRAQIEAEIALLEASLADAREEHDAGELDDAAYEAIRLRDTSRLSAAKDARAALAKEAVVEEPLPTAPDKVEAVSSRPKRRGFLLFGSCAVLLVAIVVLVVVLTSSSSPSASTQINQLLSRASTYVQEGKITEALPLYTQVLQLDPTQPEALAQSGWLTFEAGSAANATTLMNKGESQIRAAIAVAPSLAAAHLYLGVIELLAANNPTAALSEFQTFLNLKPSSYWVNVAMPYIQKAAAQAGVSVPTTVP